MTGHFLRKKMQMSFLLLCLLSSISSASVRSYPTNPTLSPLKPPKMWTTTPSVGPSPVPALSPKYHGYAPSPSKVRSKHNQKHHWRIPHAVPPTSFSPSSGQGCGRITCSNPLILSSTVPPCSCVFPMQIGLELQVAPYAILSLVGDLEMEIAAGTCLKQSQVRIMGVGADSHDQGKTIVDINLVPLGEKFNMSTVMLTYNRFWQKKVPINMSLFGDYEVIYFHYLGLPSPPQSIHVVSPSGSNSMSGGQKHPLIAIVTSKGQKMNARTVAFIALSSFLLFLVCAGALAILLKCKKPERPPDVGPFTLSITKKSDKAGIRPGLPSSIASSISASLISTIDTYGHLVKTYSLAELEKATKKFSSKNTLGEGGFGRVYLGTMEDGSEVAVKVCRRGNQNGDREFIAEVEMLSRLHHRNLIKLIGICIEEQARCLVYELVLNGSVESHLHGANQRRGPLDWDARMKIALGAARGLAYLHEDSNPCVIHRDFKSSNILLEDDFTPKVSDFGLAREASKASRHISSRIMGTFGYVAPEYAMTGLLLVKSDVYSYGVVLLELLSGRKPVDMSRPQGQEVLVTWARSLVTSREGLEQLVDPSLGGNYNFDNLAKVAAIASMCVHPEVTKRPFMGEVVQALKLVCNDKDETLEDSYSLNEGLSSPDVDFRDDLDPGRRWNGGTPHLTHGYASRFITMEYNSGPLEGIDRFGSTSTLIGGGGSLTGNNRSVPLQTMRDELAFYRLKGSISEHGHLAKRVGIDGYLV